MYSKNKRQRENGKYFSSAEKKILMLKMWTASKAAVIFPLCWMFNIKIIENGI